MIRITTFLWVILLVIAGGTVMHVSYQVRRIQSHLAEMARDSRQEEEAIRILGAEWDTLNDPKNIDALAKRHLALVSTPIQRVVALEDVPLKPTDEQAAQMLAGRAAARTGTPNVPAPHDVPAKSPPVEIAVKFAQSPPATLPAMAVPVSIRAQAATDGVGLILARIERRE